MLAQGIHHFCAGTDTQISHNQLIFEFIENGIIKDHMAPSKQTGQSAR